MDLTTYAGLKAAVADFLNKTNLTSQVPGFIDLAEAQMRRRLKVRHQVETMEITTASDGTYPLPCDFDGVVSIYAGTVPLTYLEPEMMDVRTAPEGFPTTTYSIFGDSLYFAPLPSDGGTTVTMRYRTLFCSLSATKRCNWILAKHPDAYLYGALMQAAPFLRDDDRIGVWGGLFNAAIDDINAQAKHQQYGAGVRIQVENVV